ncbi:MAG TPA: L-2-hydroxyglutarate oxidase [Thermoleophilaceae bacterium]
MIGAGILGLATAREMARRRPEMRIVVVDKEGAPGRHQTGHNSGVIHAGIYYAPGSPKARLCVAGARAMYEFCDDHGIDAKRRGKVIVATTEAELEKLDELERRARANGVERVRRLDVHGLAELEPHARGIAALHSPDTGVVDFGEVAQALADEVRAADGEILLDWPVEQIVSRERTVELVSRGRALSARFVVACAGAWSDRLAAGAGAEPDPRIVPFRGAYLRVRPERHDLVRSLIYPVPDPQLPFLGVHLTRHVDDEVMIGPTALLAPARDGYRLRRVRGRDLAATLAWPGTWRMMRRFWRAGATELHHAASKRAMVHAAQRLVPDIRVEDVEPGPSGVRAQAVGRGGELIDDFVFSRTPRALHLRNAPSPGATASLAIAEMVADEVEAAL